MLFEISDRKFKISFAVKCWLLCVDKIRVATYDEKFPPQEGKAIAKSNRL